MALYQYLSLIQQDISKSKQQMPLAIYEYISPIQQDIYMSMQQLQLCGSTHQSVDDEQNSRSDVGRDDVPLHAVDVGQLAEETEPVVHQGCHAPGLLRDFAHSEGFK